MILAKETTRRKRVVLITGSCFIMKQARHVLAMRFNELKGEKYDD